MKGFLIRSGIITSLALISYLDLLEPGYLKYKNPLDFLPWQKSEGNFVSNFFNQSCNKDQELPLNVSPYIGKLSDIRSRSIPELKKILGQPVCTQKKDNAVVYVWKLSDNNLLAKMNSNLNFEAYIRVNTDEHDEIQSLAVMK